MVSENTQWWCQMEVIYGTEWHLWYCLRWQHTKLKGYYSYNITFFKVTSLDWAGEKRKTSWDTLTLCLCFWMHLLTQTGWNHYLWITPPSNSELMCDLLSWVKTSIGQSRYSEAYCTAVSCGSFAHIQLLQWCSDNLTPSSASAKDIVQQRKLCHLLTLMLFLTSMKARCSKNN